MSGDGRGARNQLRGRIAAMSYLGGTAVYMIDCGEGIRLQAIAMIGAEIFREGAEVVAGFAPSDCVLLDADGKRIG